MDNSKQLATSASQISNGNEGSLKTKVAEINGN